jgi:hypothetical protein
MTELFFAYLDPGAGSIVIQTIVAGILGFLVALKVFWGRIVSFFVRSTRRKGTADVDARKEPVG